MHYFTLTQPSFMQAKQDKAKCVLTFKPKTGCFTQGEPCRLLGGSSFSGFLLWRPLPLAPLLVLSLPGLRGKLDPLSSRV